MTTVPHAGRPDLIPDPEVDDFLESPIEHPSHYGGDTTYEVIKVIEAWELDFHLGNTVKYVVRAGKKDPNKEVEDLQKAAFYLNRKIDMLIDANVEGGS